MHDTLKALEALQEVDQEIAELLRSGAENPKRLADLEARLGAARSAVEEAQGKVSDLEQQKRALDEQLVADKEKVKKWEARLTEQRSPREYTALAREIDIAKKQNTTASEEVVELAKQITAAGETVKEKEQAFAALEGDFKAEMDEIRKAMALQETRRKSMDTKRGKLTAAVPANMLRRYEQIHKRRGLVVVPVVSGACTGCHMNVPPQFYNQLRSHPKLDICPSCGRMIYAREAFAAAEELQAER